MFEQIVYTSCCKGRMLKNGEPSGKTGGLQVYSFSKELLDRFPRVHSDEIENMVATRCLWHPSCNARAYAYSMLSDGSALWSCNRESRPIADAAARTYHFSQGYIGNFESPAAFNMGGTNWLTDTDIRNTEGMSDVVYGIAHDFDCSTAPQADFLPKVDKLPTNGNLRTHLQNLQSSLDQDTCTNHLLTCIHWLVEHADDDRILLVSVSAKHDGTPRFDGDDTRLPDNVIAAQNVCESIMWMISYLLPSASAVKIPFTVGMQYNWLKQNAGKYRICVTADEPGESMKQLLAQGKVDVLDWSDTNKQLTTAVQCPVYDQWIIESLNGNPKPLVDFKGFCEHLSDIDVSSMLYTLASIHQAQCCCDFVSIPTTTLKVWLNVLERTDKFDWYRDLRKTIVTTVYHDYEKILDADMQNGFTVLQEMFDVSERYDNILYDTYWVPILYKFEMMLRDTVQDHTDSFVRMLHLKNTVPSVFAKLQGCLVDRIMACVNKPLGSIPDDNLERHERLDAILLKQTWTGMIGKLDFIERMLENHNFTKDAEARMLIYESALFGAAVNKGELVTLYQKFSTDPLLVLKLLEQFERRCEPPASGVKLLYQALVNMIEDVQSEPDSTVFMAVKTKYPEGVETLTHAWMKEDLRGTLRMCAKELSDIELSKLFGCLLDFNKSDAIVAIISTLPQNYIETRKVVYQQLCLHAQRATLSRVDTDLIKYYRELRKSVPELKRIYKIELMELVQAFEQNAMRPDVLQRKISTWKDEYQSCLPVENSKRYDTSIDICYFEQCANEFANLLNCLRSIVANAIEMQSKEAPKTNFLFGKNHAKQDVACDLIDVCVLLFINASVEEIGGYRTEGTNERFNIVLREEWLTKLPDIVWNNPSKMNFVLLMHLINWHEQIGRLPATMAKNYHLVRRELIDMLSSTDAVSKEEWKWVMDQARSYSRRTKDTSCEEFFIRLEAVRKQSHSVMSQRQNIGVSENAKHRPRKVEKSSDEGEEKKGDGIRSILGKLFGDKKTGK